MTWTLETVDESRPQQIEALPRGSRFLWSTDPAVSSTIASGPTVTAVGLIAGGRKTHPMSRLQRTQPTADVSTPQQRSTLRQSAQLAVVGGRRGTEIRVLAHDARLLAGRLNYTRKWKSH